MLVDLESLPTTLNLVAVSSYLQVEKNKKDGLYARPFLLHSA